MSASSTIKELYKVTNNLLGRITFTPLPSAYPADQLPQVFFDLVGKVRQIHDSILWLFIPPLQSRGASFLWYTLVWIWECHQWNCGEVHETNVYKTCVILLDPIPTSLLFECSNEIVPLLTAIVSQSLLTTIFPSCMKAAILKPLLKKTSLDPNVLKTTTQACFKSILCVQTCWENCSWSALSSWSKQSLAHLPVRLSPKTQYWDSSPSCF